MTPYIPPLPLPFHLHLEGAGEIEHAASLNLTAERELSLGEITVPVVPPVPLPIVAVPVGPLALTLTVTPSLELGASGSISLAGTAGWSQTSVTSFSASVDGGRDLLTGDPLPVTTTFSSSQAHSADSQTGPFLQTSTQADIKGFIRAGLGIDLSLSGFISAEVEGAVDAFAQLEVDPLATPWWKISTGIDPYFALTGRVLGFSVAGVDTKSEDLPAISSPHISSTSPPDPLGRPAGADTHWAKALTYTNLPLATDSTDVIPLPNKGLVTLNTLSAISLLLVEFDPYGTEVRRRALGNVLHSANRPKRVRLLPDGGLLVFASPVLIRLDASWNVVWQKNLVASTGNTLRFYDMDVAPGVGNDFSAYLAAVTDVISGTNDTTAVAIKLDANGDLVWSKAYVTQGEESFYGIRATPDGGCVAVGKTDAKWNDIREFTYTPPEGAENPFPDELDNGYVVRIAPDGSVLWAWSAAILSFNDVAVQPDGRIAASGSSLGHGIYDPWRGPAIHIFNADGSSAGGCSFAASGMPGVNKEGNLDDYASAVTTGTDGGWVLACKTGPANQTPAASFIVALTPKLLPKWLIGYDWFGSPREVPERIINRGDSYFFMGILDDGRINGAAAKDFVFLSCLPDAGLCNLLPSNRLTHGFFGPVSDAFDGKLLLDLAIGGAPRELVPLVGSVSQVVVNNYTQTITNPATTFTLTPLTDSIPSGVAPPLSIATGTNPGSLSLELAHRRRKRLLTF